MADLLAEAEQLKSGTTTVGMHCKDGIVLAADRRITAGIGFIANKNYPKIYEIAPKMALTMAGTVSDVQLLVKLIKATLKLKRVRTKRDLTVRETANVLAGMVYANIRRFTTIPAFSHFLLGGYDSDGFHIYDLYPDGSVVEVADFVSSGSGSVMAYGVLETLWRKDLAVDEGVKIGAKAINAALQRDAATGDGLDIFVVTREGIRKVVAKTLELKATAS